MATSFEKRKKSHITLSLEPGSQSLSRSGLEKIKLIHDSLPDLNLKDISLETEWQGRRLKTPFFVSSMTGGFKDSFDFNFKLAKACKRHGWILCTGSQRGELTDKKKKEEWRKIRENFPDLTILGNLGIAQVINTPVSVIEDLALSFKAQGMIIHLNPLQEALQKEGDKDFRGAFKSLKNLVKNFPLPLIVKETGSGLSEKVLDRLTGIGVSVVDLSGLGGTHFGRVEGRRYEKEDEFYGIGESFSDWGESLLEGLLSFKNKKRDYEVWASGGLRSGVDAAKALAMGASLTGFASPILKALNESEEALDKKMSLFEQELRVALFCTGSQDLKSLREEKKWKER